MTPLFASGSQPRRPSADAGERNGAPALVLASGSPRRADLLRMLGIAFEIVPADLDEARLPGESPAVYAERTAREKASAVARRRPGAVVLAADTIVVLDGDVLGKPEDERDAVAMLMRLQGRAHRVQTAVAVAGADGALRSELETARVTFRSLDRRTARAYAATGEPLDKAGAYGIQGYGATLVEAVEGDFFAVMGLPIVRSLRLLEEAGWSYQFRPSGALPDASPR